ncbi:hypothetical protein BC833DRAFT_621321 [Globomyces pollinis-pini]|nr:hypothetical protein BC833DRAFT_621321 [Globomyces pollinis-pini]
MLARERRESFASILSISEPINPAILSQTAKRFVQSVTKTTATKDMLEYQDCFSGKHGVDVISDITGISNRHICIILGRALDAQGFFYDVTWMHRFRDSPNELYKFEETKPDDTNDSLLSDKLPTGVFVPLAACYSATCVKGRCYSPTCPKKANKLKNENTVMIPDIRSSAPAPPEPAAADYWSCTVPPEVLASMTAKEITRQEVIFELIVTEQEFVKDLENTIKFIIHPLKESDIIDIEKREEFVNQVFSNIVEIYTLNSKLLKKLLSRQKEELVVDRIGDIFVNISNEIYPYVEYGGQQAFAKSVLDEERLTNTELVRFLKECEKIPVFRKLPIESFLARPTTRLGRYPLLLKPVMEKAAENHPDRILIPQALTGFKAVLTNINIEAGKAENILKLGRLNKQIFGPTDQTACLNLLEEGRQIIRDGKLMMRKNNETEVMVFLFDHLLLVTKQKDNGYKIIRHPIPLEFLSIHADTASLTTADSTKTFPITFVHPGRFGGTFILHAGTQSDRDSWVEAIQKQAQLITDRKRKFEMIYLVDEYFPRTNPVNCSLVYLNQLFIGTDDGLYIGAEDAYGVLPRIEVNDGGMSNIMSAQTERFTKVIDIENIIQIDVIPKIDMLLLLAGKTLAAYPLRSLLQLASGNALEEKLRPRKIGEQVKFFKQGVCNNLTVVCTVKSSSTSTLVKILEPVGLGVSKHNGKIGRLFKAKNQSLRQEFDVPGESRSLHFLSSNICVASMRGFELVEFESLKTQGKSKLLNLALLDMSDPNLDILNQKRDRVLKPISIFKVKNNQYLLCYNEFGIFIDEKGRRIKPSWIVYWNGNPVQFCMAYPYILAYDPSFIEIRHIETSLVQQIIRTHNLRGLTSENGLLHCVMDCPNNPEYQLLFRLKQHSE